MSSKMSLEEANAEAVRRIRAAKACCQWWLDLGDLPIVRVPDEIVELKDTLRVLGLGADRLIVNGERVEWEIEGQRPDTIADLTPLDRLTKLTSLNIRWCKKLTDLGPLSGLTALTWLGVSGCEHVTDLKPLSGLTALTELDVGGTGVTDLGPLSGLTALTELDVSFCRGVADLSPLTRLTALTTLEVSNCEQVTNLTPLAGLLHLDMLSASHTMVSDLSPLSRLTRLSFLSASGTQISDLSPLARLNSLRKLQISNSIRLKRFRSLVNCLPRMDEIVLHSCPFFDLHPSVCGTWTAPFVINSVRAYFSALGPDAKPDAEIKVFVLGNGRCGKSYLIQRLTGKTWEQIEAEKIVTTHGVQLGRFTVPADWGFDHPITLCFWDFGGQDIYHGTHALFLKEPAIYLLLHADATENDHEFTEGGFTMQNRPLGYWFDYLRQEAGRSGVVNSPVLLVKSRSDEKLPVVAVPSADAEAFPNITSAIPVSAKDRWGLNHLIPHLQDALRKLLDDHPQPPLPASWAAVRDRIRDMQPTHAPKGPPDVAQGGSPGNVPHPNHPAPKGPAERDAGPFGAGANLPPSTQGFRPGLHPTAPSGRGSETRDASPSSDAVLPSVRTMTLADLKTLCDECGCNPGDEVFLRDALALMGVVYYRKGVFGDRIIVDQGWALDAIYTVFKRDHPRFQRKIDEQKGRFTRDDLHLYFWPQFTEDDQRTFLSFMEQCGICFRTSDRHASEYDGNYILPDKLDRWGSEHERQFKRQLNDHSGTEVTATFTLLHDGIARGFLSKIGSVAGDGATYWRYGCHFHDHATDCEVMIRTHGNAIKLQAWGDQSADVLRTLVKVLEQLPCGNPPTFEWSTPPAEPIRIGRDDPEEKPEERLKPSKYGPKSVFFSYRHPHPDHPGSDRGRLLLRQLRDLLEPEGWTVLLDERRLQDGDSISEFITDVRECGFLVPVFCGRYLDSRYTLSELFTFREKFAHDERAFADRTAPVTYPESGVQNDLRQAEYVLRCRTMFDEHFRMAGQRALAPRVYEAVFHLNSWGDRLSEVLAALSDRLSSRTAEAVAERLNRHYQRLYPSRAGRRG